jgi:hypothetical protein
MVPIEENHDLAVIRVLKCRVKPSASYRSPIIR